MSRVDGLAYRYTEGRCITGKRTYDTRAAGKAAAKFVAKTGGGNLRPYVCGACGGWHIGHTKKELQNKTWPQVAAAS